jgi:hypothetical protein
MKRLILLMAVIIFSMPLLVTAQQIKKWDFGISAEFGKDYYDRNYPSEYDKYPDMQRSFQSNYSSDVITRSRYGCTYFRFYGIVVRRSSYRECWIPVIICESKSRNGTAWSQKPFPGTSEWIMLPGSLVLQNGAKTGHLSKGPESEHLTLPEERAVYTL